MKKLALRPYHGSVWICSSLKELRDTYKLLVKQPYPYEGDDRNGGRFVMIERGQVGKRVFLVYGKAPAVLAHELSHVLLIVFKTIGYDPREGDGEPFCYMLSQLMQEAVC